MIKGRDDRLREYATPRQWEILEAYWDAGTATKAAKKLGISRPRVDEARRQVARRATRAGYAPDYDLTHPVPEGLRLRGSSTLYRRGEEEPVLQWVKTGVDNDRFEALLREACEAFASELPKVKPVSWNGGAVLDDLMVTYPIGDHHLGMRAWHEETGSDDYDLAIGEKLLHDAMGALVGSVPPAKRALVANVGDFQHYDNLEPVTPRGKNQLDADGRYAKMVRVGIRAMRQTIRLALKRHPIVHVIIHPGNHDPSSALYMAEALAAIYENEPRVIVDTSPRVFHYHEFGTNLIGVCHGHEAKKLADLPLIMAQDMPEAWGRTRHRWWITGHIHHDRVLDVNGTRVESVRVLPPRDAWTDGAGYRAGRSMIAATLHRCYGEVQRVTVNPEMFRTDGKPV